MLPTGVEGGFRDMKILHSLAIKLGDPPSKKKGVTEQRSLMQYYRIMKWRSGLFGGLGRKLEVC